MDLHKFQIELNVNEKNYKMDIDLHDNVKDYLFNNISLNIIKDENTLDISLSNSGESDVYLNNLSIHLATFRFDSKSVCVLNNEDPSKEIELHYLEESKSSKELSSYLFGMLLEEEFSSNYLFGFLCSHISKNCIKYVAKERHVEVYAFYNFGFHKLSPNEILKLDTLYMDGGNKPFNSFNNYMNAVAANFSEKQLVKLNYDRRIVDDKSSQYNILFTKKPCSYSIKVNNKPISVKIDKEKMYPIDIAANDGKGFIFDKVKQLKEYNNGIVYIKYVYNYLEGVLKHKVLNSYFELNNLFLELRQEFENIVFYFDNCPLGMAIGNNAVLEQKLELNKKQSMLKKLIKKKDKYDLNYNFIIKMMLKRSILDYNTKFDVKNHKVKVLLETITGGLTTDNETEIELDKISEDIDTQYGIIPYIQREDVFGFVAKGKEAIYMAVFNLSESPVRFYCDLSMQMEQINLDGVVNEVFTDTNYLVSNGKFYIRNFPAMDCCLFKKTIA